jgi:hypothetical protein
MPKTTFQDILPPEKRSIRDIPLPVRKNSKVSPKPPKKEEREEPEETEYENHYNPPVTSKKSRKKLFLFIIAVLAVLCFIFFSTSLFSGATVRVTPHSTTASIDVHGTATRESNAGALRYDLITVEKEGQKTIDASTTAPVSIKATGKIVLYNNFSAQPQGLVKNTRLESSNGLIYRLDKAVSIPGKTASAPGSIEASVTADAAGDKYNLGPSDFTVPGFKDDPARYAGFYGRSKTALSGGFVGVQPVITDKDKQAALESLSQELQSSLKKEISSQKPDTFVLYDDALVSSTQILPSETGVKEKITLYGIIFNKQELSEYVAANSSGASLGAGPSDVTNLESLTMTFLNKPNFDATTSTSINFSLKGKPIIVSHIDIDKLRADLAGKTVKSAQNLLSTAYPMIEKMEFIIRPFWKSNLPADPNQMVIDILTPQ